MKITSFKIDIIKFEKKDQRFQRKIRLAYFFRIRVDSHNEAFSLTEGFLTFLRVFLNRYQKVLFCGLLFLIFLFFFHLWLNCLNVRLIFFRQIGFARTGFHGLINGTSITESIVRFRSTYLHMYAITRHGWISNLITSFRLTWGLYQYGCTIRWICLKDMTHYNYFIQFYNKFLLCNKINVYGIW